MKFPRAYTLREIADLIQTSFVGPEEFPVLGINEIHVVTPGDIVFVDHPKYYSKALESAATIVLINKEVNLTIQNKFFIYKLENLEFQIFSSVLGVFDSLANQLQKTEKE